MRGPRMRPSDERAELARSGQTSRRLAIAAMVIAIGALALAAWRFVIPAGSSCQDAAWAVAPAVNDLPSGWTVNASQYDVLRKQMTLLGAAPSDDTTSQAVVYATITCFPDGAADAVDKSMAAAKAAGQTVTEDDELGDQGFNAVDASSGAAFVQFRHGDVVVYLAASGDATPDEVSQVGSAFDIGMGGDGHALAIGTPDIPASSSDGGASEPPGSDELPSDSPVAAELEAKLPKQVGSVGLSVDSVAGADLLGDNAGSRAIVAALRDAGKTPDDLKYAEAYDDQGATDLALFALSVEGMKPDVLKNLVIDQWLSGTGAGVKRSTVTLGGHELTKIDFGGDQPVDYVLAEPTMVRVIETTDASLAEQAAAALP